MASVRRNWRKPVSPLLCPRRCPYFVLQPSDPSSDSHFSVTIATSTGLDSKCSKSQQRRRIVDTIVVIPCDWHNTGANGMKISQRAPCRAKNLYFLMLIFFNPALAYIKDICFHAPQKAKFKVNVEMAVRFPSQSGKRRNDPERAAVKRGADPDPGFNIAAPHQWL